MRESVIEKHLTDRIKDLGGLAPKFKSPQRKNVPDRIVLMPGASIEFVELKATGEEPNDGQLREHERLRALGFTVLVIDSKEEIDRRWPR